jgi:type VI secretion system FHA domain protein
MNPTVNNVVIGQMKLTLSITAAPADSALTGQQFVIDQNPASLGRKPDNQCLLPDNERIISSHHAIINLVGQQFILTDTSTNGTFVNGSAIASPTPLKSGDIINIGKYSFSTTISSPGANPTAEGSFLDELTPSSPVNAKTPPPAAPQDSDLAALFATGPSSNPPSTAFNDPSLASNNNLQSNNNVQSNTADDLDRWLEPDLQPASQQGLKWDSQNKEALSNLLGDEETDPLAMLDQAAEKIAPGNIDDLFGDDDPDWWSDSQADNAPALSHAIDNASLRGNRDSEDHRASAAPLPGNLSEPLADKASNPDPLSALDELLEPSLPEAGLDPKESQTPWEIKDIEPQSIDDFLDSSALASPALLQTTTESEPSLPGFLSASSKPITSIDDAEQTTPGLRHPAAARGHEIDDTGEFDPVDIDKPASPEHDLHLIQNQDSQPNVEPSGININSQSESDSRPVQGTNQLGATQTAQDLAEQLGLGSLPETQLNQLIPEVSAILQETTSRLLEVLIARSSVKNEMRLERTMIKSKENNPLKFSVSGEDALRNILNPRSEAFLSGKAAIEEAFDDLADHQMALLAGMQQAYDAMLNSFSPESLEQRFPNNSSRLIPGNKKARNWEAYQEYFVKLQSDKENAYNELFGGNFTKAYEDQIAFLKKQRQKH